MGTALARNFFHPVGDVAVTVHGDVFTASGPEDGLEVFKKAVEDKYEVKTDILGPGTTHKKNIRVLNRLIRWTQVGIEYELDQRHAELVVKALELQGAKAVCSPWTMVENGTICLSPRPVTARDTGRYWRAFTTSHKTGPTYSTQQRKPGGG